MPLCAALLAGLVLMTQRGDPRALYTRAIQLEEQGNHPAALTLLWEAAGALPAEAEVQNRLGEALERIGALEAAIEAYGRALQSQPEFSKAFNNLVLVLVKAGRGGEAVGRARAWAAAAPGDPERLFALGLAQTEQDVDAAVATFRRVLALAPRYGLAHYNLALVLKRIDRPREAIDELHRAIAVDRRPEAYVALGGIHYQDGDFARAEAALHAAIAAEPRNAGAHALLGAVRKSQRRYAEAVDALRRAIALEPDLWSARATLATVLQLAGEEAAARQESAESERLRRQSEREREAAVWTAVGTASLDRAEFPLAAERFRRAVAVFDGYAPAHYQLGRALQRLGEAEAARAAFARAHQLNPSLAAPDTLR